MYFLLKTYFINLSLIFFPGNSSWRVGGGLLSWKSKQEWGEGVFCLGNPSRRQGRGSFVLEIQAGGGSCASGNPGERGG